VEQEIGTEKSAEQGMQYRAWAHGGGESGAHACCWGMFWMVEVEHPTLLLASYIQQIPDEP
jgi:hypothetical protein